MTDFEQAFKEFVSLERRYTFVCYDIDAVFGEGEDKETVGELLYWADWERENMHFGGSDYLEMELQDAGRSEKQIDAMKDRATAALNKFVEKWQGKGYKIK